MNTIFVHRVGRTEQVTSIDRGWLSPASGVYLWVDLAAPSIPESLVLTDSFAFHPLAVEETRAEHRSPAIDAYAGYLVAAIAGADADVSFFVGSHYIVSVHWRESKAIADQIDSVSHGGKQFAEGPFAMFHRLVDAMVDGFGPAVQALSACADGFEKRLFEKPAPEVIRDVLRSRRDTLDAARRLTRQRKAIARLAGGKLVEISSEMAIRVRHVQHKLVRLADEASAVDRRLADLMTSAAGLTARKSWL